MFNSLWNSDKNIFPKKIIKLNKNVGFNLTKYNDFRKI